MMKQSKELDRAPWFERVRGSAQRRSARWFPTLLLLLLVIPACGEPPSPNNKPSTTNDFTTVSKNAAGITIDVLQNDSDADGHELSITSVSEPNQGGMATIATGSNITDTILYTPTAGFTGPETFTYSASDGEDSTSGRVDVTVFNDAPDAENDALNVINGAGGVVLDVLTNDSDRNGDALSISAVGVPDAGGSATISTGSNISDTIRYTPTVGFAGVERFDYTISDGEREDTATVEVTVSAP